MTADLGKARERLLAKAIAWTTISRTTDGAAADEAEFDLLHAAGDYAAAVLCDHDAAVTSPSELEQ